jgi:hypothetical protein
MIAVDTLVHKFLHRTGILARLGAGHAYGPACYAPAGCAEILERIAANIDARRFNPAFPATFPRFVQHAVWFSAQRAGSTSAMAGRSMIASAAAGPNARFSDCATAYP